MKMKSGLRILRAKKNISQEKLANILNVQRYQISNIENMKTKKLDVQLLTNISNFFDKCPIQDIIFFVDEKEKFFEEKVS